MQCRKQDLHLFADGGRCLRLCPQGLIPSPENRLSAPMKTSFFRTLAHDGLGKLLFLRQPNFWRERDSKFYISKGLQRLWVTALFDAIVLGSGLRGAGNLEKDLREHGKENPEFGLKMFKSLSYQQALFSRRD